MMRPLMNAAARIFSPARVLRRAGVLLLALMLLPSAALADRAIAARYIINANGDIALIGNAILTCTPGNNIASSGNWSAGITTCANSLSGAGATVADRNDGYYMQYIDIDSDTSTFNSSSADLSIPAGSTVAFAGLYWSGLSSNTARGQVLFKTPLSFGYSTINASTLDTTSFRNNSYQGFADVTSMVAASGNGTYMVANIQTDPAVDSSGTAASGNYGAWGLIVVYKNNSMSLRNLAVYDGFQLVNNSTINIPVSGFLTPLSGPVSTRLGALTYEGDRPAAGDTFSINGTQLTDANNPVNNFFNCTISDLGVSVTNRNPASNNNLVFDIDRINVPVGVVGNGATSANISVTSPNTSEQFLLGGITFSTELYVPIITPNISKTATDMNGGNLVAGDILRWTVTMSNTGLDTATNLSVTDDIPAEVTYKPGTLSVVTGANNGGKTDGSGDDQAEFQAIGNGRVTFRLGTGADATTGGNLPYTQSTSFIFDTIVNSGLAPGTAINNSVTVSYRGQTIGDTYAGSGAAASAVVMGPPTISKSFSPTVINIGAASVLTIVVGNPAGNPAPLTGVSFSDTYPSGLVNAATPNPQITCTAGGTVGTLTGGVAGGNSIGLSPGASIPAGGSCTVTVNVTSALTGNYTNTTSVVSSSNGGNSPGASSAILSVGKPSISKSFSPASILMSTGSAASTITFTLNNPTITALTTVNFSDTLSNMVVATTPAISNGCGGTVTAVAGSSSIALANGTMTASGSCSISVNVSSNTMGVWPNTTTGVSSTQTGSAGSPSNTAYLTVVAPPVLTKSFYPTSVRVGTPSQMTITISNPNSTATITGATFTDVYPAGLANDTPANPTLNCTSGSTGTRTGGANGTTTPTSGIGISAATLLPGGSCTVTVNVDPTTTGNKTNTTSTVTTTNAGTGATASATLNVPTLTASTVTKSFAASTILVGGTTTMTITLTNPNSGAGNAVTGVAFTDNFPPNLVMAAAPLVSNSCGGVLTGATSGSSVLSLSGGTIAVSSSCSVVVTVTSSVSSSYTNSTGVVTSTNNGTFGPATATIDVLSPPVVSKSFVLDAIAVGTGAAADTNKSLLVLTFTNPTTATVNLVGVGLVDNFPTGLRVHNDGLVAGSTTCTNAFTGSGTPTAATTLTAGGATVRDQGGAALGLNDTGIQVTGLALPANTSCTVAVRVYSATAGTYTNTTNGPTSTNGGTGVAASAVLTVGRPDIAKTFATSPIAIGGTSQMTITLTNPTATAMGGAAFTDTYPSGMTNTASPSVANTCGGTVTAAANGGSLALSGGSIPANGSCTIKVNTTSTQNVTNTIPVGGLVTTSGGSNGTAASATLLVYIQPTVLKKFTPAVILPGGTSTLSITLNNTNSVNATTVAFTDTYPSGLTNKATPAVTNTCGGTVTAAANGTSLALSGGVITANSSCVITVSVGSATAGAYLNNSGAVTTANIGSGASSSDTLTVMAVPTVAKSFSPNSVSVNTVSVMTITLSNSNAIDIDGAAFTDTYPSGLVNDSTPNATTSCTGGSVTATAGGNSLALSGGSIPASGSCTVTVRVLSATAGSYVNNTGAVTTTNAGSGASASGTLTVNALMPVISLLKLVSVYSDPLNLTTNPKSIPGAISAYTIRVTNSGSGVADNNSVVITDPLPTQTSLYVGDIGTAGTGPVLFTNGSPVSGLSWTFTSLSSTTDSIDFSNNNGSTWTYTPVPDANGFDVNVNRIRLKPSGAMNAASGGNPYAEFQFRVRIK